MKATPRKDTNDSSRRTKCELWGVAYAFDPNEPAPPPVDQTAPSNPPTPNP